MTIYHSHHIIPKHMGGTNDPSNLIKVNVAMHAFLHKQLWEEHGHEYDRIAYESLSKMIGHEETIRQVIIASNKIHKTGKTMSEETKRKISASMKGKKKSAAHIKAQTDSHRGTKHPPVTDENREKYRQGAKRQWKRQKTNFL